MTNPENDPDLNPAFRSKAADREASEEKIDRSGFANLLGVGRGPLAPRQRRQGWLQKRQAKVTAEIERNRRGEYTVPTWVLTLALVVLVGGLILAVTLV
jgi:hypothetical protein